MKVVRIQDGIVVEIIPEYALPVEKWYGAEFAARCSEAPDDVAQGMVYDVSTGTFSEPVQPVPKPEPPTNNELAAENKLLKAQVVAMSDRNDFMEECIAEMATLVYTV